MKILILKTSSLGDVIHTFPVLSYLRKKFPHAVIDWLAENGPAELIKAHPDINNVIILERARKKHPPYLWHFVKKLRRQKYDLVFDLQGNSKSGCLLACVRGKCKVGFARKNIAEWPNLLFTHKKIEVPLLCNVREENLFMVQSYFQDRSEFKELSVQLNITQELRDSLKTLIPKEYTILVCPGSFWPNKQLSCETLIQFLKNRGNFLLAWGNDLEKTFCEKIQETFPEKSVILPKLSLPLLQNLMGMMQLVVAMDSLPLHLAATTKVATFSFFGPTCALKYAPLGEQHRYIQGSCPYGIEFTRRCPKLRSCPTGACIKKIEI